MAAFLQSRIRFHLREIEIPITEPPLTFSSDPYPRRLTRPDTSEWRVDTRPPRSCKPCSRSYPFGTWLLVENAFSQRPAFASQDFCVPSFHLDADRLPRREHHQFLYPPQPSS